MSSNKFQLQQAKVVWKGAIQNRYLRRKDFVVEEFIYRPKTIFAEIWLANNDDIIIFQDPDTTTFFIRIFFIKIFFAQK